MPHPLTPLLIRPLPWIAGLVVSGVLFCLASGFEDRPDATPAPPAVRHAVARLAIDHLDRLRALTVRLDAGASEPRATFDQNLKHARTALGADMIALREMAVAGDEETALKSALAALALYQAAWTEARVLAQSSDIDGAHRAGAAAGPLGDLAASAVASLAHAIDQGNATTEQARLATERNDRRRAAGLALLMAGLLLLCVTRGRPTAAGPVAALSGDRGRDPGR